MSAGAFTARQAELLGTARCVFLVNTFTNFPLYYLPGLRSQELMDGDGSAVKFPCSISWMTRKGCARVSTLVLWNAGWALMTYAFFKEGDLAAMYLLDWGRAGFMLCMYLTGFVAVVLTPMMGPDVALGMKDLLHSYAAITYVFFHVLANQFVLGVPITSAYGMGFFLMSNVCGVCQLLRADGDRLARSLHARYKRTLPSFATCKYVLELGFMLSENLLFLIFLLGMNSGVTLAPRLR